MTKAKDSTEKIILQWVRVCKNFGLGGRPSTNYKLLTDYEHNEKLKRECKIINADIAQSILIKATYSGIIEFNDGSYCQDFKTSEHYLDFKKEAIQ